MEDFISLRQICKIYRAEESSFWFWCSLILHSTIIWHQNSSDLFVDLFSHHDSFYSFTPHHLIHWFIYSMIHWSFQSTFLYYEFQYLSFQPSSSLSIIFVFYPEMTFDLLIIWFSDTTLIDSLIHWSNRPFSGLNSYN